MSQANPEAGVEPFLLAPALLAVAGFADAVGYLSFGLYPSFMSGNTTNLGVAGEHGERPHAVALAGVVVLFVAGAFLGRLVRLRTRRRAAVLLVEATLLAAAAGAAHLTLWSAALALTTLAMGLQNAALSRAGALQVGTYVTGALVRLGAGLADAVAGGRRWRWAGDALLWLALLAGAGLGVWAFGRWGLEALGVVAAAALALALVAAVEPPDATDLAQP